MNSRIYLQPDAIPTQDMIRTANRLFRHFGKEITFLQQPETGSENSADITMNRLRWALSNLPAPDLSAEYQRLSKKAGNLVIDLTNSPDNKQTLAHIKALFDKDDQVANLVVITSPENIQEFTKSDQTPAKRK